MDYKVDYIAEVKVNERQKVNLFIEQNASKSNEAELKKLQSILNAAKKN